MIEDGAGAVIRPLRAEDMAATLDMWVAAWQAAYPAIDFASRREWARDRIAELERDGSIAFVAWLEGHILGAVVLHPGTGYLDQIVVATAWQGRGVADILLAEARRTAPAGIELDVNQDNARAIRFYQRQGFVTTGTDVNPRSGAPIFHMRWQP